MMTAREGIVRAIEQFGSERKLGEAIGYTQSAICRAKQNNRASPQMAINIEAVTDGKITRRILCPDIFNGASHGKAKLKLDHGWVRTKSKRS